MKMLRGVVLLGLAAAIAAGTAAAGGDAGPPLYPSLVNVQLVRAQKLLDTAAEPVLTAVSTTLFAALTARDTAIAYIHSVDTPAARSSSLRGGAIAGTWATTMPGVAPIVDDELTQIDGIRATVNLSPGRKRILDAAELQDVKTGRNIANFWPPVV